MRVLIIGAGKACCMVMSELKKKPYLGFKVIAAAPGGSGNSNGEPLTRQIDQRDFKFFVLMFEGKGADHLGVLHLFLERLEPDILGILTSQFRTEYRYLFTN